MAKGNPYLKNKIYNLDLGRVKVVLLYFVPGTPGVALTMALLNRFNICQSLIAAVIVWAYHESRKLCLDSELSAFHKSTSTLSVIRGQCNESSAQTMIAYNMSLPRVLLRTCAE